MIVYIHLQTGKSAWFILYYLFVGIIFYLTGKGYHMNQSHVIILLGISKIYSIMVWLRTGFVWTHTKTTELGVQQESKTVLQEIEITFTAIQSNR